MEQKKKLLFYFSKNNLVNFGIAKILQEKFDFELYAIFDLNTNLKFFFKNQRIVKFTKEWYLNDVVNDCQKIDLDYLSSIEKKFNIDMWKLIFADPLFHNYNQYHNFKYAEILSIVQTECQLFDEILESVNPNYIIMKITDNLQTYLLHDMCYSKGVKILTASDARCGSRIVISSDPGKIESSKIFESLDFSHMNMTELQKYVGIYSNSVQKIVKRAGISNFNRVKLSMKYFFLISTPDFKNFYANKGRNLLSVLKNSIFLILKSWYRKKFLDSNCRYDVETKTKIVYFPIHLEPERSISIAAPHYADQLNLITNIAKSLPIDCKLYVKEHPMSSRFGWHPISFYKKLFNLPNVEVIHPSFPNNEILQKSSLIVTISGTTSIEAAFYGIPSIIFADSIFSKISLIKRIKNIEELPNLIRQLIGKKISESELNDYVEFIKQNSFEFDLNKFVFDINEEIKYGGVLEDIMRDELNLMKLIEKYRMEYELLTGEFVKKIHES